MRYLVFLRGGALMLVFSLLLAGGNSRTAAQETWQVLRADEQRDLLRRYLRAASHEALDQRLQQLEGLETPEDCARYQERLKEAFIDGLGGFPERTPLGVKLVGKLERDDLTVEKLIFESRPGVFVTALLYLPKSPQPYPGVLVPCGHSENGKAYSAYQKICLLLAKHGLAALCYDPLGQGERKQILEMDNHGHPLASGLYRSTSEHMHAGAAPIPLGENLATYMIWDGMRALDLLAGRQEIAAKRLGCTGNSGGGNLTAFLMALDERIYAAAPGCFVTTTRQKNDSPGPGDAEQNLFGQTAVGLDHPDLLMLHAPKPALICAATHDFVPIAGTWDAFRQAKRFYTRLGYSERIDLVETDAKHGFTRELREAATQFMRRWLLDQDGSIVEGDLPIFSEEELRCTPQGQVLLLPGARSIFDVTAERAKNLAGKREQANLTGDALRTAIRQTAAIRKLTDLPEPQVESRGKITQDGLTAEKLIFRPEPDLPLPALLFRPQGKPVARTLYLHGQGKTADLKAIQTLLSQGHLVLSVDLRGYGETRMRPWRYGSLSEKLGNNTAEFFVAYMLGRSLLGMRCEDVLLAARYLGELDQPAKVNIVAIEGASLPALHAVALEPQLFASAKLSGVLRSWESVCETPVTDGQFENLVHGALRVYDLPDLVELAANVSVESSDLVDAAGNKAPAE